MEIEKSFLSFLMFSVDGHRFAVPTTAVRRVLRAAAVTPLPESPTAVHGVLNLQGEFLLVLSSRICFGLMPRDIVPNECFIVLRTEQESFALVVDAMAGVADIVPHDFVFNGVSAPTGSAPSTSKPQPYAVRVGAALVLLCDPQAIFSDAQNRVKSSDAHTPDFSASLMDAPLVSSAAAL